MGVEELSQLDMSELAHLRVRSDEYIAAILLAAFLRRAPMPIDVDGGVDLLFDLSDQPTDMRTTVNLGNLAAFEIKSLPGDFRRHDARETDPSTATAHHTVVRSAKAIMREAIPSVRSAAEALARRCPPGWSRNTFLVIHPFDHLAVEMVEDLVEDEGVGRERYEGLSSHDLRRANATGLVVEGVDVKAAQTVLGHSEARSTLGRVRPGGGEAG